MLFSLLLRYGTRLCVSVVRHNHAPRISDTSLSLLKCRQASNSCCSVLLSLSSRYLLPMSRLKPLSGSMHKRYGATFAIDLCFMS